MQQGLIGKIYRPRASASNAATPSATSRGQPTPAGVNWDLFLGPAPHASVQRTALQVQLALVLGHRQRRYRQPGRARDRHRRWALGDPEWPKSAFAFGGKYVYDDDQETPNTLLASFDYGGREIVFEVRGILTGGEGTPVRRMGPAARADRCAPGETDAVATGRPATRPNACGRPRQQSAQRAVGNLFYGSEGWAAMNDAGFQAYKGESSELIMEERPERGPGGDGTSLHMENFLAACRSRNVKDLHDPLSNAQCTAPTSATWPTSATAPGTSSIWKPGPRFTGDAEADKMLTRDAVSQTVCGVRPRIAPYAP
jgi:hypothetical protein